VSAVILAGIGPLKPFWDKDLITHSQECGRAKDEPPTRSHALAQRRRRRIGGELGRAKGTHMPVSAVSAEIAGGTLPEKRFSLRCLRHSVPVQHARVGDRPGGSAAHRSTSLVSAVMLAGIGPVKPFLDKRLIAHSEACAERAARVQPRARTALPHRREPGHAWGRTGTLARSARRSSAARCRLGRGSRQRPCEHCAWEPHEVPGRALRGCGMKGFRGKSGSRRAAAHSRDLRPARQAADRVGQRPTDDRPRRAAVDVVARGAVQRHVAGAVARISARVCSAPQCRTATIARARASRPHPDRAGTLRRRSWPCSSTATSRPRSRSHRLQAKSHRPWLGGYGAAQHPAHNVLPCT
jgi:hypothetical protein